MKRGFVDFHTHTIFSDGVLLPSELVQRLSVIGCKGVAITDHADCSNLEFVLQGVLQFAETFAKDWDLDIIPGVELTHVPPKQIGSMTKRARELGAKWVVVHGETTVEPVAKGTNRAAIDARVDLLAHPGLITEEEAILAERNGVYLEITTRRGHSLTNGLVVNRAREAGASLLLNTDMHAPGDILDGRQRETVALGAGLEPDEVDQIWGNSFQILDRMRKIG